MMLINFKSLLKEIPTQFKKNTIGPILSKGISDYYKNILNEENFDIDSFIVNNIQDFLANPEFIKTIKRFNREKLEKIGISANFSNSRTKTLLADHFQITIFAEPEINLTVNTSSTPEVSLHDFQERMRQKALNLLLNNHKRFLIHMPTGSGKTRTMGEILIDFIRSYPRNTILNPNYTILWVAQSKELCHQAYETVEFLCNQKLTNKISFGHAYDGNKIDQSAIDDPSIIFCSIQTLLSNYLKDSSWKKIKDQTVLVVVDEAHRSVASQWVRALNYFVDQGHCQLIGLTATPGSAELDTTQILANYYHNNIIKLMDQNFLNIDSPISNLVERQVLASIERTTIDLTGIKISTELDEEKDEFIFTTDTLNELASSAQRNKVIMSVISEELKSNPNASILVFTCGLDHNYILKHLCDREGFSARRVDQLSSNRNQTIEDFKAKRFNVLINFGVLTTGFDAPRTNTCVIARPIGSLVLYSQMVGRILRGPKNGGNISNNLYTLKDNINHGDYDKLFEAFDEFYK